MIHDKVIAILSECGEYVPIIYIESINPSHVDDNVARTAYALRGDYIIRVRLASGKEYLCPMQLTMDALVDDRAWRRHLPTLTPKQFYEQGVFNSWRTYIEHKQHTGDMF